MSGLLHGGESWIGISPRNYVDILNQIMEITHLERQDEKWGNLKKK